jgi:hypothetical protein
VYYHVHHGPPPMDPILSQKNPVHTVLNHIFKTSSDIILSSTPRSDVINHLGRHDKLKDIYIYATRTGSFKYLYRDQHKTEHCNKSSLALPYYSETWDYLCSVRQLTIGSIFEMPIHIISHKCISVILRTELRFA